MKGSLIAILLYFSISIVSAQNKDYTAAQEYFENQEYTKALKSINKAIKKRSKFDEYHIFKSDILKKLDKPFESLKELDIAIYCKKSSEAFLKKGHLLINFRKFKLANESYEQAIRIEKVDSIKMYYYLSSGAAKSKMRDFEGSIQDYKTLYAYDSTCVPLLINMGADYIELGESKSALKLLYKAIDLDSMQYLTYVNIGYIHQNLGEYQKAIECFDFVIKKLPKQAYAYNNRGFNKFKLGDIKGAYQDIKMSLKLNGGNAYAYRNLALVQLHEKKDKKACENIEKALNYSFTKMYGNEMLELKAKHCTH